MKQFLNNKVFYGEYEKAWSRKVLKYNTTKIKQQIQQHKRKHI